MQFHYRAFSSIHVTGIFLELLYLIYLSDFRGGVTYDFDVTLFHIPHILKLF